MTARPVSTRARLQPQLRLQPLALAMVCMGLAPALAQTLPTGFNQVAGTLSMNQAAGVMNIQQTTQRAIAQWQSFSIGAENTVNIFQPGTRSVLLNRVMGTELSTIAGKLNANGHVFLVNPSGVVFSKGSQVSVGGLVASTLNITNDNFLGPGVDSPLAQGSQFVFAGDAASTAKIRVESDATIGTNAPGGLVALVGGVVRNDGVINVAQGSIGLVSGSQVTLDFQGDGLTQFKIGGATSFALADIQTKEEVTPAQLTNTGQLIADGGRVMVVGASTIAQQVVNHSGVIQARSLTTRGGEILLGAVGGTENETVITGQLDVSGGAAGVAGGMAAVLSGQLRMDGASVDASGTQGGQVFILGSQVALSSTTQVKADGSAGNGGAISVQGNAVHVSGTLSARGTGAGGQVLTKANVLEIGDTASVDAGGGSGANGQWTVDSKVDLLVTGEAVPYAGDAYPAVVSGTSSRVNAGAIGKALGRATDVAINGGAYTIDSENQLSSDGFGVAFAAGAQVVKTEGRASTLTVNSTRHILMDSGSTIGSKAGALNVDFNADAQGAPLGEVYPTPTQLAQTSTVAQTGAILMDGATIETAGGNVRFYGQSDPTQGRAVGAFLPVRGGPVLTEVALPPSFIPVGGITVSGSTISTCAMGSAECGPSGSISLRGQGNTVSIAGAAGNFARSSTGIDLVGTTLRTGGGGISIDGRGGLGSAGVRMSTLSGGGEVPDLATVVQSASGPITITGSSRSFVEGSDPALVGVLGTGGATGVAIDGASIATGGDVTISGTGAQLGATPIPVSDSDTGTLSAGSVGTRIRNASLTAGAGRTLSVSGTAGSRGYIEVPDLAPAAVDYDPNAVEISVNDAGQGLRAAGGRIAIDGRGGDVSLRNDSDGVASTLLSVANANGAGGSIEVDGRNILLSGSDALRIDATGAGQGGQVTLRAHAVEGVAGSGIVAVDSNVVIDASAGTAVGNGGEIRLLGERSLMAYGTLAARGGAAGGNGGFIETSGGFAVPENLTRFEDGYIGGGFDLSGLRVDASAPAGQAGTWLIDPYNVTIQDGSGTGALPPGNPSVLVPVTTTTIQDGDINAVLDAGTSVRITTGTGGTDLGNINFGSNVVIERTVGTGRVSFELDAANAIGRTFASSFVAPSIQSTTGPMDVRFNAGRSISYEGSIASDGGNVTLRAGDPGGTAFGQVFLGGQINSNGGAVTINAFDNGCDCAFILTGSGTPMQILSNGGAVTIAAGLPGAPSGGAFLQETVIDTRVGQSDAGAGGAVAVSAGSVGLFGTQIASATGDVTLTGAGDINNGVVMEQGRTASSISTTSGNVLLQGVVPPPQPQASSSFIPLHGVVITGGSSITTGSGNITLHGANLGTPFDGTDSGVRVEDGARLITTGGGSIELTGSSASGGPGVSVAPGIEFSDGVPVGVQPPPLIQSSGNVVLRASNGGSTDALVIEAPVVAAGVINLRPGGVDAALNASDAVATPITLGGSSASGFAVSDAELAQLSAPTLVAGSNTHAGAITVASALSSAGALTLQNEGAGSGGIALNAAVTADRLGLLSAGNITQTASAPIVAQHLLARSTGGSVLLDQAANNVSANTLGGGAAGAFRYQDVDALRVGSVSVTGFDAAGNAPQIASATSMAADTVFVRTLSDDLILGTHVSSSSGTNLVAASRFQNAGSYTISGAPWRVWADTWVGETRGGLAGSGPMPNFYNCAFSGLCGVTLTTGTNSFIYRQQPDATVVVGNAIRPFGFPNPPFSYFLSGLILGDTGAGFSGTLGTTALRVSPPGFYPITGSFTSAEGYRVTVVPGQLQVTSALNVPQVDVLRELPTTYLYDRNIGQAPICFATGPLDGDRASQGGDVLAREWSRVRSRPNLLNCVDTERRNGCADF